MEADTTTWPAATTTFDLITVMVALRSILRDAPEDLAKQKITQLELETLRDRCKQLAEGLRHYLDTPDATPDLVVAAAARSCGQVGFPNFYPSSGEASPPAAGPDLLTLAEAVLRPQQP